MYHTYTYYILILYIHLLYLYIHIYTGADWITIPTNTYSKRLTKEKTSRCNIEIDVYYNYIQSHTCIGIYNAIAPIRILSFDIECQGRKGVFPDALYDPVIQVMYCIVHIVPVCMYDVCVYSVLVCVLCRCYITYTLQHILSYIAYMVVLCI